jgi:transcriptional regulator with XRE-family HTH domain
MDEASCSEQFVPMKIFAERLKDRAAVLGLSNAEVARRTGLSERRYGHYVSGSREPDLATLARIARALGTSPNHLLGYDDDEPKPGF